MASEKSITSISGTGVYVAGNDIDTDRIIPARYMRCVTFEGIGKYAFYDVRFNEDGSSKGHVLDRPEYRGVSILISDNNFGCGSSREHAPQALAKFGVKAIIAGSFAEIFFGNATLLGIPCVSMPDAARAELAKLVETSPKTKLAINLKTMEVSAAGRTFKIAIKDSARKALINGTYDPLFELLEAKDLVRRVAERLGYA